MKRFYLMPLVFAATLGLVFVLPKRGNTAHSSLSKEVNIPESKPPLYFGEWSGVSMVPSEQETDILAKDTTFVKGAYTSYDLPLMYNARGQAYDPAINLSIVISGSDINNSIHRPERCLGAQGHNSLVSLPDQITTPKGRNVKVQRITSQFPLPPAEEGGLPFPLGSISYYYFVGHHQMTHSHWNRILVDMKDRLISGTDQQWSFVMVSLSYNIGKTPEITEKNKAEVDKKIRQFLGELTDRIVAWDEINAAP